MPIKIAEPFVSGSDKNAVSTSPRTILLVDLHALMQVRLCLIQIVPSMQPLAMLQREEFFHRDNRHIVALRIAGSGLLRRVVGIERMSCERLPVFFYPESRVFDKCGLFGNAFPAHAGQEFSGIRVFWRADFQLGVVPGAELCGKIIEHAVPAFRVLEGKGWKNVKVVEGGVMAWPYPREK